MNNWDKLVEKFKAAPLKYKLFGLGFAVIIVIAIVQGVMA